MPCNTDSTKNGWCYIEQNGATMGCAQEILFSKTALASGVVTSLQCLESSSGLDSGAAVATPVSTGTPASSDAGSGGD